MNRFHALLLTTAIMTTSAQAQTACDTTLDIAMPAQCAGIGVSHPVEGLANFRELTTPDNGIRQGQLFRSDQLHDLTDADLALLSDKAIETVVDLRAANELETHPNRHIPSVDFTANLPIGSDPADVAKIMPVEVADQIRPLWFEGKFTEIDALLAEHNVDLRQTRLDRYEEFATDFAPQVSRFLHLLTEADNYPVLFHCAGGKDRTGYIAAVTLLVLGYSEEDVMRDYLVTNVFTYEELEQLVGHGPASLRPAFGAHPEQMTKALQTIKDEYGSFDLYLSEVLDISAEDIKAIRQNLLTDS
ncbi:tyrosine-protein phosphatase [Halocynthiibacter styelae]|uniref:Tyrosine-protein phosphatase n=1 Tax=Halocynthiibacter styelae TaxID=2761955 RepID=A0A8J7LKD6_9RHOB|nr:tyrosine-protein phosphatase [Paenihalocynthiibacter styelae]MBI1492399.1 tyrosine-protein phosphatase [Paenihalocynthiibacter styelae]